MNPIRLLLVDDEAVFLKTLADRFKKRGIPAMTAGCGRRCLEILEAHSMDVVILDVKMPDLDGLEVLDEIKRSHMNTEVILLTGHGATEDGVAGIKAGAFDYLTKPVEIDHLLKKILQAHEKKQREEEKKVEEFRRAAMEKQLLAAERLAALGVLASGVAHEINNPLAIIQSWRDLLSDLLEESDMDILLREEFERGFEKIDLAVRRAKQITAKMLGSIQKRVEQPSDISPSELLENTLKLVRESADRKHVSIVQLPGKKPALFRADPYPVQQVLLNVINNAVEATPEGGAVTCRVALGCDRFIAFEVEDAGEGVPPEILGKIFDPFFTTKPAGDAAGLGLYVSRKIMEKMGGAIDVDNIPGKGAVFTARFPLNQPSTDSQ